ncbi:glutathione s-transferase, partial [Fusarium albosuccineum]
VLFKFLNIKFVKKIYDFNVGKPQYHFLDFSPTGRVPVLYDDSIVVWDSLAICEHISERHPGVWPANATARAFARSVVAEMHSGFFALRAERKLDAGQTAEPKAPSEALPKDIDRLNAIFNEGIEKFGGPWLAGDKFTIADAFFSPISTRVKTYGIELEGAAKDYMNRLFDHPAVQDWVQDAMNEEGIPGLGSAMN